MIEEPLNVGQAARFLGLKKGTVYNMIARRALPFHKVGRRVLFTQAELEAWFQSTLVPCVPGPRPAGKKMQRKTVDVEAIVKNAIEQCTRG
jgi:excisionase family DNA binding protein